MTNGEGRKRGRQEKQNMKENEDEKRGRRDWQTDREEEDNVNMKKRKGGNTSETTEEKDHED